MEDSPEKISHIYHKVEGIKKVLCGFSDEVPSRWPPGHIWYHIDQKQFVDCKKCLAEAELLID